MDLILSYLISSNTILPHFILSHHGSYLILSYLISSNTILSHFILSHHVSYLIFSSFLSYSTALHFYLVSPFTSPPHFVSITMIVHYVSSTIGQREDSSVWTAGGVHLCRQVRQLPPLIWMHLIPSYPIS